MEMHTEPHFLGVLGIRIYTACSVACGKCSISGAQVGWTDRPFGDIPRAPPLYEAFVVMYLVV